MFMSCADGMKSFTTKWTIDTNLIGIVASHTITHSLRQFIDNLFILQTQIIPTKIQSILTPLLRIHKLICFKIDYLHFAFDSLHIDPIFIA